MDFWQNYSTVILNMLGVKFEKIKNVTFLIYNEGTFFSKKDLQLHSSFKMLALKNKVGLPKAVLS